MTSVACRLIIETLSTWYQSELDENLIVSKYYLRFDPYFRSSLIILIAIQSRADIPNFIQNIQIFKLDLTWTSTELQIYLEHDN